MLRKRNVSDDATGKYAVQLWAHTETSHFQEAAGLGEWPLPVRQQMRIEPSRHLVSNEHKYSSGSFYNHAQIRKLKVLLTLVNIVCF